LSNTNLQFVTFAPGSKLRKIGTVIPFDLLREVWEENQTEAELLRKWKKAKQKDSHSNIKDPKITRNQKAQK